MIVLTHRNTCLATPPRTASRSVHFALAHLPGAVWVEGPEPNPVAITLHTLHVPRQFLGYRWAIVVRHPLDRLYSLWKFACADEATRIGETWEQFARAAVDPAPGRWWAWHWTISRYAAGLSASAIRFESLGAELERLTGHRLDLPTIGRISGRPWKAAFADLSADLRARLIQWATPDAEAFGYHLPCPAKP